MVQHKCIALQSSIHPGLVLITHFFIEKCDKALTKSCEWVIMIMVMTYYNAQGHLSNSVPSVMAYDCYRLNRLFLRIILLGFLPIPGLPWAVIQPGSLRFCPPPSAVLLLALLLSWLRDIWLAGAPLFEGVLAYCDSDTLPPPGPCGT